MSVGRFLQQAAAGNAGEAVYVDDVFSTYLYRGTQSAMNITNDIDLAGEGGLVWIKRRGTLDGSHYLWDTERGSTKRLSTNTTNAEGTTDSSWISSFNSDGFSIGTAGAINNNSYDEASWTFRKQPGFFDVVTYTGNGTNQAISHNLGSTPGFIVAKRTDNTSHWICYHSGLTSGSYIIQLNTDNAEIDMSSYSNTPWSSINDSSFTVGHTTGTFSANLNGATYVAYLFAHDAQDFGTNSNESIIKCGAFTGNPVTVDLGWEPQWILLKKTTGANNWFIYDTTRGWQADGTGSYLQADQSAAEVFTSLEITKINSTGVEFVSYGGTWVYVAIRRPHKPASEFAATDLFAIDQWEGATTLPTAKSGFPVDMAIWKDIDGSDGYTADRMRGRTILRTNTTDAESGSSSYGFDYQNGYLDIATNDTTRYSWMFRRAPGFFDVVAYTGTGSTRTVSHNLGVAPELMIIKGRTPAYNWQIYAEPLGNTKKLEFTTAASGVGLWNSTSPTDSVFTVSGNNNVNQSTAGVNEYIAYLFASVPGISKVGSYTGTGSDVNVDCGFTSGARFVLVKRTDSTGDWYVWDSERGIVAGNDPYLLLNTTAAQVTSTDYIDPLSSGFTITSSAPAALNASGGSYIFLAIA